MPFEGEKFEEIPTPPEEEKEEVAEEKEEKIEKEPEEKPEVGEKEKIEEKEEKIEFPPDVVFRKLEVMRNWEREGHFHPRFEGKSEKEILKELLEKKDYQPLTKEGLNEFHHFMYTGGPRGELNPNEIGYKHYVYDAWAIGRGEYESSTEEREAIQKAKELQERWEAQMKELWGPGWLLNTELYKSLSKGGRERVAKEILDFWDGFHTGSGVELDSRLEKTAALTNPNMVHYAFKPHYERNEDEEEKISKARQKIYKEFAETKTFELELIENDLSPAERELVEEIRKIASKKYAHVLEKN